MKEVVNFNNIAEDYFQQVQEAVAQAESAAREADGSAQAAAGSAEQAAEDKKATNTLVERALGYFEQAEVQANIASQSATFALRSEEKAQQSAAEAAQSATESQASAEQSRIYSERALQYNYEYSSVAELPVPGSTRYIYMIPKTSPDADDYYDEYAWSESNNDYSFIGTSKTSVDLSNYYTKTEADTKISAEETAREAADTSLLQNINAKYTKPSTGIPKSDLNSSVQTSVCKADTAYQKPSNGIPESDLAQAVKDKLNAGGIKQNEVIVVKGLYSATADSPDFLQTPGGTLYRKKYTQTIDDYVIGIYRFNDNADRANGVYNLDFTSNGKTFTSIEIDSEAAFIRYNNSDGSYADAFMGSWVEEYRIITVTNVLPSNVSVIQNLLTNYAVKQPSTTYSYAEIGASGTAVVANPSAAGTEDLTKLQVANTVYNIPSTEIVFSTDAADDSAEVAGFSVESQNFKFKSSKVLYDYSSSDPNINWGKTGGILSGQTVTNSSLAQYSVYRVYIRLSSYTAICLATSNNMNFVTTFTGVSEGNDGLYAMRFKITSSEVAVEYTGYFTIPSFTWNNRPGDGVYCIYKIEGVS